MAVVGGSDLGSGRNGFVSPRGPSVGFPFAIGLGVVNGVAALGQVNIAAVGLMVATFGVVATARRPSVSLAAFAASALLSFGVLWLVAGQHVGNVPAFRSALSIATGYSKSMGAENPQTSWSSAVALLSTVILVGLFWLRTSTAPRRDRLIRSVSRHWCSLPNTRRPSRGADAIYLATLLALWPVAVARTHSWAVASGPVAGLLATFVAVVAIPISTLIDPVGRAVSLGIEVDAVLFHRAETATANAASLRTPYSLPTGALAELTGRTVHVEPYEIAAAYAYPQFAWNPLPVIQAYVAYTQGLDHLDSERLAGPDAPERILWLTPPGQPLSIDGRGVWFDAPSAKIEMLCRYRPVATAADWQVLGRIPKRCGAFIPVATVEARAGQPVTLPSNLPEGIGTMRVLGVADDLASRLQLLAYRGAPGFVSDGRSSARIPIGTASQPNVIGATGAIRYCGPLGLASPPTSITVAPERGAPGTDSPLTLGSRSSR